MSESRFTRRELLRLLGVGTVVHASGLWGCGGGMHGPTTPPPGGDFTFLQLTDTHWGYVGAANPEAEVTLERAVAAIAASSPPDLIVFTGDLTHTTLEDDERHARMTRFSEIVRGLDRSELHYLPGEHDAAPDGGEAFVSHFGPLHHAFTHGGVRFVAIDNASRPGGEIGAEQLEWLRAEVGAADPHAPLVVLAHRPLFDLRPDWEWATADGATACEILGLHDRVHVFYGHIHQTHRHVTGNVTHHASRSLVFPLPAPDAAGSRAPLPWDASATDHGLGWCSVRADDSGITAREIPA